jgi:hypothetical protein
MGRAAAVEIGLTAQHLTSPPMSGDEVRETQLMLRHNPYGMFEPGSVEGVYDELTANAVRRAKYWLGYPESQIDETCDDRLRRILAGEEELPATWRANRARRLARAREGVLWERAWQVATEELGRREDPPGSKRTPYSLWYGVLGPWGVMFASFCYAQAGSRSFRPRACYAYAPYMLDDAHRNRNELSVTREPLRGDIALVDVDGDGRPERAALFDEWQDAGRDIFSTVEGDVGLDGETSGEGSVARTRRAAADVAAFVHVRR